MLLSDNRFQMRRSSEATSDGQMDHGQVRKPRISRQKPVTWPDTAFGHLTGYAFVGRGGSNLAMAWCVAGGPGPVGPDGSGVGGRGDCPSLPIWPCELAGGATSLMGVIGGERATSRRPRGPVHFIHHSHAGQPEDNRRRADDCITIAWATGHPGPSLQASPRQSETLPMPTCP